MTDLTLRLEIQQQPLRCEAIEIVDWPTREGDILCGRPAEFECEHCHAGVCILCGLTCLECGFMLHDFCREEHAKETGHQVDLPQKWTAPKVKSFNDYDA